jgi:hypothetical protein
MNYTSTSPPIKPSIVAFYPHNHQLEVHPDLSLPLLLYQQHQEDLTPPALTEEYQTKSHNQLHHQFDKLSFNFPRDSAPCCCILSPQPIIQEHLCYRNLS